MPFSRLLLARSDRLLYGKANASPNGLDLAIWLSTHSRLYATALRVMAVDHYFHRHNDLPSYHGPAIVQLQTQ